MIADAIRQAQKMHRTMIEQTYDGTCSIYQMVHEKDPDTRVTKQQERQMASGILCHLSFSGTLSADAGETVTTVQQTIRLFLNPEQEIPPGCRIEVSQQGRTESYGESGKAAVYSSHQEIVLELWKGYA